VLSNVGDGGAMADIGGGFWACRNGILVDIAGLSAIIRLSTMDRHRQQ